MGEKEDEKEKPARETTYTRHYRMQLLIPANDEKSLRADVEINTELIRTYCRATCKGTHKPVLTKMTPNQSDILPPALAAVEGEELRESQRSIPLKA